MPHLENTYFTNTFTGTTAVSFLTIATSVHLVEEFKVAWICFYKLFDVRILHSLLKLKPCFFFSLVPQFPFCDCSICIIHCILQTVIYKFCHTMLYIWPPPSYFKSFQSFFSISECPSLGAKAISSVKHVESTSQTHSFYLNTRPSCVSPLLVILVHFPLTIVFLDLVFAVILNLFLPPFVHLLRWLLLIL